MISPFEAMVGAYNGERQHWSLRVNKGERLPHEIVWCHFSEDRVDVIEAYDGYEDATYRFEKMRANASMRAALLALAGYAKKDSTRDWLHAIAEDKSNDHG